MKCLPQQQARVGVSFVTFLSKEKLIMSFAVRQLAERNVEHILPLQLFLCGPPVGGRKVIYVLPFLYFWAKINP
jgi:hypothetical protein